MRPSIILIMLSLIVIAACAGKATPTPKTTISPEVQSQKPLKAAWEDDWERTIQAAKSEGKIVIYTGTNPEQREALRKGFEKRFGITMEMLPGAATQLAAKIIMEYRANIHHADMYLGGASTILTMLKPAGVVSPLDPMLILPEVLDPKVWYGGQIPFVDKDHITVINSLGPSGNYVINTSLVNAGKMNSYQDLLDPRWKGKIILADPTMPPGGDQWFTSFVSSGVLSLDYMRSLAKQEPLISRDRRMAAEWLSRGKYAISIGTGWSHFIPFKEAGSSIERINPVEGEYISAGAAAIALMKKAPRPNAAKLFANWFLSKEGAEIMAMAYDKHSTRLDVPTEGLSEDRIRRPGEKYIMSEKEELYLAREEFRKMAEEIFGHLLR